ncbi:hypothetical protein ACLKA6_011101 [Drosophila palustris]
MFRGQLQQPLLTSTQTQTLDNCSDCRMSYDDVVVVQLRVRTPHMRNGNASLHSSFNWLLPCHTRRPHPQLSPLLAVRCVWRAVR